jgi:uncharacterized protein (TIGR02757 family)
MKESKNLREFLNRKVEEYNRLSFIEDDPIGVPHRYSLKQDIEIAGFFAAIFSWGNRTTIIRKSTELMQLMDDAPYQFVRQHEEKDLRRLLDFRHRTFNATDLLYFIAFFREHYSRYDTLEDAFLRHWEGRGAVGGRVAATETAAAAVGDISIERALSAFRHYFFSLDNISSEGPSENLALRRKTANDGPSAGEPVALLVPPRTGKHISSPEKNSSCKRLNMFLRWMVRKDDKGVDFGIWERISPRQLICPLDLHVARVARRFGLLLRTQTDWQAAIELTGQLALLDPEDPVKYDFALFGLGVMEKF